MIYFLLNLSFAKDCGGLITCDCGDRLVRSYNLNETLDCSNSSKNVALTIYLKENINLNCNDFSIVGDFKKRGILILGSRNINIQNCNFKNFSKAIEIDLAKYRKRGVLGYSYYQERDSGNLKIFNSIFKNNEYDIYAKNFYNLEIFNSNFSYNKKYSINLIGDGSCNIYNNIFLNKSIYFTNTKGKRFCKNNIGNYYLGDRGFLCDCIYPFNNLKVDSNVIFCSRVYYNISNINLLNHGNVDCKDSLFIDSLKSRTLFSIKGVSNTNIKNCNIENYNRGIFYDISYGVDSRGYRRSFGSYNNKVQNINFYNNTYSILLNNKDTHISLLKNINFYKNKYNIYSRSSRNVYLYNICFYNLSNYEILKSFNLNKKVLIKTKKNKTKLDNDNFLINIDKKIIDFSYLLLNLTYQLKDLDNLEDLGFSNFSMYNSCFSQGNLIKVYIYDEKNNLLYFDKKKVNLYLFKKNYLLKFNFSKNFSKYLENYFLNKSIENKKIKILVLLDESFENNFYQNKKILFNLSLLSLDNINFRNKLNSIDSFNKLSSFDSFKVYDLKDRKYIKFLIDNNFILNKFRNDLIFIKSNDSFFYFNKSVVFYYKNISDLVSEIFYLNFLYFNSNNFNDLIEFYNFYQAKKFFLKDFIFSNINQSKIFINYSFSFFKDRVLFSDYSLYSKYIYNKNNINENEEFEKFIFLLNNNYLEKEYNFKYKFSNKTYKFRTILTYPINYNKSKPFIILAGGLWSDILTFEYFSRELSRNGYITYRIEITGDEMDFDKSFQYNYNYSFLTDKKLPFLIQNIVKLNKKRFNNSKYIYIGHSNGARVILNSLEHKKLNISNLFSLILLGVPGKFEEKSVLSSILINSREKLLFNLERKKIYHPRILDIMFNVDYYSINALSFLSFNEKNRISLNLFNTYLDWMSFDFDENPGKNLSLNSFFLIYGDIFLTNDGIVSVLDEKNIYKNIVTNNKRIYNYKISHTNMNENKLVLLKILNILRELENGIDN